jgi:UDPglucose 6-dehydrogenase
MHRSNELGAHGAVGLLQQVDEINMGRRQRVIDLALKALGGSVLNRRIGVLGAAFKPHTDDVRDSPALNVAAALHLRGAQVVVYDPQARETAQRLYPTLGYADSMQEALAGADLTVVLTEWDEFTTADPAALAAIVRGRSVIDGRNCLDASAWNRAGWSVHTMGTLPEGAPLADDLAALAPAL